MTGTLLLNLASSRRRFLRQLGATLAVCSELARPARGDLPQKTDILVIGAGASGLCAARELRLGKRTVLVLEARDRLGGRIWTDRQWVGARDRTGSFLDTRRGRKSDRSYRREIAPADLSHGLGHADGLGRKWSQAHHQ